MRQYYLLFYKYPPLQRPLFLLLQVSFDVAWSPNCIDQRCYQYAELATVTDYLVIMSYDERSQIYGPCVAGPNSGYNTTATGILQYRALGLNTSQLILGVPWYGYNYPCLSLSDDHVCSIDKVPFRGADCSDAAGIYTMCNYYNKRARFACSFILHLLETSAHASIVLFLSKFQVCMLIFIMLKMHVVAVSCLAASLARAPNRRHLEE